jgi:hypothetical protein
MRRLTHPGVYRVPEPGPGPRDRSPGSADRHAARLGARLHRRRSTGRDGYRRVRIATRHSNSRDQHERHLRNCRATERRICHPLHAPGFHDAGSIGGGAAGRHDRSQRRDASGRGGGSGAGHCRYSDPTHVDRDQLGHQSNGGRGATGRTHRVPDRRTAGVRGDVLREDFDGDGAIQSGVSGFVDFAHATGTEVACDLVRAEHGPWTERHLFVIGFTSRRPTGLGR